MKKIFLVMMMGLALMLGLIACNKESSKTYTFRGKVVEMYMNNLIVEPLENEVIRHSADKIQVWIGQTPEFHPPIFPAGTLVEIEYDGNIAETYPAQINAISLRTITEDGKDIIPSISEREIPTTIAYANWAENDGGLSQDKNCVNADKYIFSDFPRLPTFKFDARAELDEFKNKYQDTFTMNHGYNEVASFDEVIEKYDDAFFQDYFLILTYKGASSGSFRYAIDEVVKEGDTLILKVTQTNHPEAYTDDMAGWFLMAEVPQEYMKECKSFDTQLKNEYSYDNTTEKSNQITIRNGKNDYDSINVARLERFIENTNQGIGDEIEITQYTIEGDPIITTIHYNETDGTFKVIKDTTKDKFGAKKVTTNQYDNSYQASMMVTSGDEVSYYDFNLINEKDKIHICGFHY